jgi:calcium-dependent protein kinase
MKSKLAFDPKEWKNISDEAKDLLGKMLDRDVEKRFTADQCLEHPWFKKAENELEVQDIAKIMQRIKTFNAPRRLQKQTLLFLANSRHTDINESLSTAFDFKSLKNAFRKFDTDNSGTLHLSQMKSAFAEAGMSQTELTDLFHAIDFNGDGEMNYSEFLAAAINKEKALSNSNLSLAFHHFDTDGCGFITADHLVEVFKRQGQNMTIEEASSMITEASPE